MTTELSIRPTGVPSQHEMAVYQVMSKQAAESKMYKNIGDENGLMMVMLAARELGIGPVQALNGGLNIINGKVEISARLMNAMIRRSGHRLKIKETSDKACIIEGIRSDTGESLTASYTLEEAKIAGLVKPGGGWTKNPKDMCFARALSRLARQLFADVIGIGYIEGEISNNNVVPMVDTPAEVEFLKIAEEDVVCGISIQQEDLAAWDEYCNVVMAHFGWDKNQLHREFNKDYGATEDKFKAWKIKNKK
jgi:hypothetical protein